MNLQEYNKAIESLNEQRRALLDNDLDEPIHLVSEREGDAFMLSHRLDLCRLMAGTLLYAGGGEYIMKKDAATWVSTYDGAMSEEHAFMRLVSIAARYIPIHYIHIPGHGKSVPA